VGLDLGLDWDLGPDNRRWGSLTLDPYLVIPMHHQRFLGLPELFQNFPPLLSRRSAERNSRRQAWPTRPRRGPQHPVRVARIEQPTEIWGCPARLWTENGAGVRSEKRGLRVPKDQ